MYFYWGIQMKNYDYLIVGAGLFGSVFAFEAKKKGKSCLVVEKRNHIAGNIYTENIEGINVHRYGAHIFHTSSREIWDFVNQFSEFNNFVNSPLAIYKGKLFNLPFNMNTFYQMWGVKTPSEAKEMIIKQKEMFGAQKPRNLEEQAISLIGEDIYKILVKGYTEKQWGRECRDLPASIIRRLPVRFTYDNNYFNDRFQGIPIGGYTKLIEKMLEGIEVRLNTDYLHHRQYFDKLASKILFTGPIDAYFDYCLGALSYRSVRFETEVLDIPNYQGVAVVNYTERNIPFTRIIEHKHFEFGQQEKTVISREYPSEWMRGGEPYYPVNDHENTELYNCYYQLATEQENVLFGGRLGSYKYYDMDKVIAEALKLARQELH